MIHPISDFRDMFPEAFGVLLGHYQANAGRYKGGGWICSRCLAINPYEETWEVGESYPYSHFCQNCSLPSESKVTIHIHKPQKPSRQAKGT